MREENAAQPVQSVIEEAMSRFGLEEERWESMALFSSDGLPMASCGESPAYSREELLEFSFSLMETVDLLKSNDGLEEIVIRSRHKRLLVFRYFQAWDDTLILAAVLPGKKAYRRAVGRVIKKIRSLA